MAESSQIEVELQRDLHGIATSPVWRFLGENHHRVITKPFRPALVRQAISEELAEEAAS